MHFFNQAIYNFALHFFISKQEGEKKIKITPPTTETAHVDQEQKAK